MRREGGIFQNVDWLIVILYLALMFLGWISIYAAVYNEEHQSILDISQRYGKQLIWIGLSLVVAFVIMIIDGKFFANISIPVYVVNMLLLVLVLALAREVAGARSWFEIGSFKFQPAEFAKAATGLALAGYLSGPNARFDTLRTKLIAGMIILIPAVLILLQNDTGSALVFGAFMLVLYREGLSGTIILLGLVTVVLFILALLFEPLTLLLSFGTIAVITFLFIKKKTLKLGAGIAGVLLLIMSMIMSVDHVFNNVLEPHQQTRINVLLGLESDIKGAGYNVHQSKIAIGSGGFTGKGFLKGTQTKFDFVPEQSTDFIFCTVGEEWGFLGSTLVVLFFILLIGRIYFVAERQRSSFSRIYGYGVASVLLFHFTINVGMTLGLMPVIGIPLPFFSYGGSSLLGFTLLLVIFIRLDGHRLELLR